MRMGQRISANLPADKFHARKYYECRAMQPSEKNENANNMRLGASANQSPLKGEDKRQSSPSTGKQASDSTGRAAGVESTKAVRNPSKAIAKPPVESSDMSSSDPDATLEMADPIGTGKVFGQYRIKKLLGQGAMGSVYLADDLKLERKVALKIPKPAAFESPDMEQRFVREAKAAASLQHPLICPIYEYGTHDGHHYLAMAYIKGKPLSSIMRRGRTFSERQAALLIRKLALALQTAHEKGVIHRDLKPANIMINDRKEPIVMDFGLARREGSSDAKLTSTGMFVGTPAYTSPEQVRNLPDTVGPGTDVYSLGVILYELLTGRRPFEAEDAMTVLSKVLAEEPPSAQAVNPDVGIEINRICMRAMRKDAEKRFASMAEFAQVLTAYLKSNPPQNSKSPNAAPDNSGSAASEVTVEPMNSQALDLAELDFLESNSGQLSAPSAPVSRPLAYSNPSQAAPQKNRSIGPLLIFGGFGLVTLMVASIVALVVFNRSPSEGVLRLKLNVVPDDLTVTIDDATVEREQILSGFSLRPGSHQLSIESSDFVAEKRWFEISADETLTIDVSLTPLESEIPAIVSTSETTTSGELIEESSDTDDPTTQEGSPTVDVKPELATGTIILENFEKSTFEGWTVEGGAFGAAPLPITDRPRLASLQPWQSEIGTFAGSNHLWHSSVSPPEINHQLGKLTSEPFILTHQFLNFFLLGGHGPGRLEMRLRIDDQVMKRQTGFNTDFPLPVTWDVSEWAGKSAIIEIVDDLEAGYLPYIGVDNISLSDLDASKAWELELERKIEKEAIEWNGHKYWFPEWVVATHCDVHQTLARLAALCGGKPISISSDDEHHFFMSQIHGDTWLGLRGDGNGRYATPEGAMGSYFRWIQGVPEDIRRDRVYCDIDGDWTVYDPIDLYAYVAFEWGADSIEPHLFADPEKQKEAADAVVDSTDSIIVRTVDRYVQVSKPEEMPDAPFDILSIRFKPGYAMPRPVRTKFRGITSITRLFLPETRDITLTLVTDLPELRHLELSGRDFDGRVLARLPDHDKLRVLSFRGVDLDRSIYRYFSETRRLKNLTFVSTATEPATLAPFLENEALRRLEFNAASGLGDRGLAMISRFPNLHRLVFWASGLSDRNARVFESLDKLRAIQFGSNREFRGGGLQYLAKNRHLRELSLFATEANDEGLTYMPELPRLQTLTIGRTRVTDLDARLADKLPNLEDFGFESTLVGNDDLERVSGFRYLRSLGVTDSQVSEQAAKAFAQTRAGLRLR